MLRYFKYFDYYLETFVKRLSGRGLANPEMNGEYTVLEKLIENLDRSSDFCFIDGGSNIGGHVKKADSICKRLGKASKFVAIEPFPRKIVELQENLLRESH